MTNRQHSHTPGDTAHTSNNSEEWTTKEMRDWIDNQPYSGLLHWWRFAPTGDPFFQGETGEHYSKTMAEKRALEKDGGAAVSKLVGWDDQVKRDRPRKPG